MQVQDGVCGLSKNPESITLLRDRVGTVNFTALLCGTEKLCMILLVPD